MLEQVEGMALEELAEAMEEIKPRESFVLRERYQYKKSFGEIGKGLNLTRSRIHQIHARAVRRLRYVHMRNIRIVEEANSDSLRGDLMAQEFLTRGTYNKLMRLGVESKMQLLNMPRAELERRRGFGEKNWANVERYVEYLKGVRNDRALENQVQN